MRPSWKKSPPPDGPAGTKPERPVPFGYKTGWLRLESGDPREVISALGLKDATPCGWTAGLEQADEENRVFVSPALDGSVLVVGWVETELDALAELAQTFPSLQYFASYRVVDYCAWVSFRKGTLRRAYAWEGDQGEVTWDRGELTAEETALGGENFPRRGKEDQDGLEYPDEETVLSLAAAWGFDTSFAHKKYPAGLGWLCRREEEEVS